MRSSQQRLLCRTLHLFSRSPVQLPFSLFSGSMRCIRLSSLWHLLSCILPEMRHLLQQSLLPVLVLPVWSYLLRLCCLWYFHCFHRRYSLNTNHLFSVSHPAGSPFHLKQFFIFILPPRENCQLILLYHFDRLFGLINQIYFILILEDGTEKGHSLGMGCP